MAGIATPITITRAARRQDTPAVSQQGTLARQLAVRPLTLSDALRYAADVAATLRHLHEAGQAHGCLSSRFVLVNAQSANLLLPGDRSQPRDPAADIAAFGCLFQEMLARVKPRGRTDAAQDIHAAAAHLASQCMAYDSRSSEEGIRPFASQVRLLNIKLKLRETQRQIWAPLAVTAPRAVAPPPPPRGLPAAPEPLAANQAPGGVMCPKCGVPYMYPSRQRGRTEAFLALFQGCTMRCRRCQHRFVIFLGRFCFQRSNSKAYRATPFEG